MKKTIIFIFFLLVFTSCTSINLSDSEKYDYSTSGAISDDCFQVIITVIPDKEMRTMAEQRENSFIKAKDSIPAETEKQIIYFYSTNRSISTDNVPQDKLVLLKQISEEYSRQGVIDQEYYMLDNSAVLIYRIFKKGIKNEILNI